MQTPSVSKKSIVAESHSFGIAQCSKTIVLRRAQCFKDHRNLSRTIVFSNTTVSSVLQPLPEPRSGHHPRPMACASCASAGRSMGRAWCSQSCWSITSVLPSVLAWASQVVVRVPRAASRTTRGWPSACTAWRGAQETLAARSVASGVRRLGRMILSDNLDGWAV